MSTTTPEDLIRAAAEAAARDRSQTAVLDQSVPLRPCEPWCEVGNGHAHEMPGDRYCRSDGRSVTLSRVEPYRGADGNWFLEYVAVSLRRDRRETVPCLVVRVGDGATEAVELTKDEAQTLVTHVQAQLALLGS